MAPTLLTARHSPSRARRGSPGRRGTVVLALTAACLLFAPAGTAQATATSAYHPDPHARSFAGGDGGWAHGAAYEGLCVPMLTCPALAGSFAASGGAGGQGDGFLRTTAGPSPAGLAATSISTWTSPEFVYEGADGAAADSLDFSISRRADVATLLQVAGNSAEYSVRLEPISPEYDSGPLTLIGPSPLSGAEGWTPSGAIALPSTALTIGEAYRFVITTRLESGVELVPASTIDYDNVVLRARRETSGGGGGGGPTNAQLKFVAGNSILAGATLRGNRLRVGVRCHKAAERPCRITRIRGMLGKRDRATNRRKVNLAAGKARRLELKLRSARHVRQVRKRKRITLRQTVRVGNRSKNAARRIKVRIR